MPNDGGSHSAASLQSQNSMTSFNDPSGDISRMISAGHVYDEIGKMMMEVLLLTPASYKNSRPDEKKKYDIILRQVCKGFLESPDYKSGDTTNLLYKACCEVVDYCSFYYQTWFYIICTAVGFLFINLVSIVIVCIFMRKKSGGKGGVPKNRKAGGCDENVIESNESIKNDDN